MLLLLFSFRWGVVFVATFQWFVWLMLIPYIGYIFMWMMLPFGIPKSVQRYSKDNAPSYGNDAYKESKFLGRLGIAFLIMSLLYAILLQIDTLKPLGYLISLITLGIFIFYWKSIVNIRQPLLGIANDETNPQHKQKGSSDE